MAPPRRNNDLELERNEDEEREYRPPSRRTISLTIAMLFAAGLLLIAYFILELRLEELGGYGAVTVVAVVLLVVARAAMLR